MKVINRHKYMRVLATNPACATVIYRDKNGDYVMGLLLIVSSGDKCYGYLQTKGNEYYRIAGRLDEVGGMILPIFNKEMYIKPHGHYRPF